MRRKMSISEASAFFDEHDMFERGAVYEVTDIKLDLGKNAFTYDYQL